MIPYASAEAMRHDDFLTDGVLSRRVAAWFVDATVIALLLGAAWSGGLVLGVLTFGLALPLLGWLPVLPLLYTWLSVASPLSATPGQALFGLAVVRDDDLDRPGPWQALASAFGYYLTVALGGVWLAVALLTTRRRTLHDMVSGLVVVRARALTGGFGAPNIGGGGWTPR